MAGTDEGGAGGWSYTNLAASIDTLVVAAAAGSASRPGAPSPPLSQQISSPKTVGDTMKPRNLRGDGLLVCVCVGYASGVGAGPPQGGSSIDYSIFYSIPLPPSGRTTLYMPYLVAPLTALTHLHLSPSHLLNTPMAGRSKRRAIQYAQSNDARSRVP